MSDTAPENSSGAEEPGATTPPAPDAAASKPVVKPARRAGPGTGSGIRRAQAAAAGDIKVPPKPDTAKSIAIVVCGLLLAACVVAGVYKAYKVFFPKPQTPKVTKLSEDAEKLKDMAVAATQAYEEGQEKAKGTSLADLTEAEAKLDQARELFNEVASKWQTVPGYEDKIKTAHDKKDDIDKELLVVRRKKADLEMAELRTAPKTAPSDSTTTTKPAATAPATATAPAGKEPTEEELSDKNLDRLFTADPDEYERLAKIRAKRDPNFKMKQP